MTNPNEIPMTKYWSLNVECTFDFKLTLVVKPQFISFEVVESVKSLLSSDYSLIRFDPKR